MIGRFKNRQVLATASIVIGASIVTFFVGRMTAPTPPSTPVARSASPSPPDALRISAEELAAAAIVTEAVMPGNLSATITAPAMVDAEIRGQAVLAAQVPGMVVQITKRLGDAVKAGETLAVVQSRDAAALAAAREVAESRLVLARSVLAREKSLYDQMITPRQDLERAQADLNAAEAEARRARAAADAAHVLRDGKSVAVISPLAGKITSRTADLGRYIQADTELFRVSDPRFIDIDAAVTGVDAERISAGDHAKVATRAGLVVNATVRSVSPTVNEQTRTANVVIDPDPGEPPLTPGDLVQVEITPRNSVSTGIIVPDTALQNLNGRTVVFVRAPDGFKARPVVVGTRSRGKALIVSGLEAGTTIATANAFLLKAELNKGAGEEE